MRHLRLLALVAFVLAGCHGSGEVTAPPTRPPGAMTYSGHDASGRKVVTGWIRIDVPSAAMPAGAAFEGTWSLRALVVPRRYELGPQVGFGTLEAEIRADGTAVSLNPGCADDCVFLFGTLTFGGPAPMKYEGTWEWNTLTGSRNSGTFSASE
jgi:hypothetical protein